MDVRKVKWEEMLPDEFLDAIQSCPVCYMAYGLAEPHGSYNALGLDWLKAYGLCEKAALTYGGIVAPPFCWHVQEQPHFAWLKEHGVRQPLSSSLPCGLFLRIVLHQLRAFDARGFHVAVLVTGHYGGLEKDMRLLCEYYQLRSGSPLQIYCVADSECIEFEDYKGDHAGLCETQQLMAIRPDLVDLSREEPSLESGPWCGTDFSQSQQQPDAEIGIRIVQSQVEKLGRVQEELLDKYQPVKGWSAPDQDKIEEMWDTFDRLTRKYWVLSLSLKEFQEKTSPKKFPGWDALLT